MGLQGRAKAAAAGIQQANAARQRQEEREVQQPEQHYTPSQMSPSTDEPGKLQLISSRLALCSSSTSGLVLKKRVVGSMCQ